MVRFDVFENGRPVVPNAFFAKPDKCSGVSFLRYGRVIEVLEDDLRILVQMHDLDKPTKVYSLATSIFIHDGLLPMFAREKFGLPVAAR